MYVYVYICIACPQNVAAGGVRIEKRRVQEEVGMTLREQLCVLWKFVVEHYARAFCVSFALLY
jgi:hypothetical protein